ncbi:hypothetical protein GYMLUDRAFT_41776 [Collybiopsis luxurians FD-317 M1]|uniref:Small ribosomal subunit protein uS10m n=1 Tax=Collybiopsis luxurians FD-317 M1 TaxID=944289 RepID=A0A0D0D071_9AGAR|nr:hypothetical protein GYMLUDRAFT_41776 [Collybiopsis luxurians FD-317 M1]
MYRVSSRAFWQSISTRLPQRARSPLHPHIAALHGSTVKFYPRKPRGKSEDDFDPASILEQLDKDESDIDGLGGLDPVDMFDQNPTTEPPEVAQSEQELFGYVGDGSNFQQTPPPISPLPSGLDPRNLPVKISSLADLGPKFSEEAYASALVHGRSIHLPYLHPRTHSIPAGNITFYSHHPRLLALFTHFASHAASSLGIPISKVIMLPTERRLWTVIRSPFVYKKSQENFERKTHKRMIKAWDADPEVIDRWVKYLENHSMGGVGIRVTKWERLPLGIGNTRLANLKEAFKVAAPEGVSMEDVALLQVQEEPDSDANRKQAIQALSTKIFKEESHKLPKASNSEVNVAAKAEPAAKSAKKSQRKQSAPGNSSEARAKQSAAGNGKDISKKGQDAKNDRKV